MAFRYGPTSEEYRQAGLVGQVIGRNAVWPRVKHVEMMEKESETSIQMRVELGLMYELGEVVPQDLQRARELYESADLGGDLDGTVHLGCLYMHGLGTPVDIRAAWELWRKAAKCGHAVALAVCKYNGARGFPKDRARAIQLLKDTLSNGSHRLLVKFFTVVLCQTHLHN